MQYPLLLVHRAFNGIEVRDIGVFTIFKISVAGFALKSYSFGVI